MLRASMRMLGTMSMISSSAANSTCSQHRLLEGMGITPPFGFEDSQMGWWDYLRGREDGEVRVRLPGHEGRGRGGGGDGRWREEHGGGVEILLLPPPGGLVVVGGERAAWLPAWAGSWT
jgi:hypothetical protein